MPNIKMSAEESDVELQKSSEGKNEAKNQEAKKITTKDMVHQALTELKSRKGTSLYAIKKYIEEKYKVDVDKLNYIIKKTIKLSVLAGTIVQTKGIGASGSFKLAPEKQKPQKKKPKVKKSVEKLTSPKKTEKSEKLKKVKSTENKEPQKPKKKVEIANPVEAKAKKEKSKKDSGETTKKEAKMKTANTSKMAEAVTRTPAKKKSAMMKRKSIGSIIKPPKMNPKKG